ncbi:MAG: sigma-70 family RNA polymerase sigma factor [Pedosphaera sp.]|nr:sigma-70 family RNA polymerase sigma factor [Pedosphaera sp.]
MTQVIQILARVQQGDPKAAEELMPLVYEELRGLAAARMAAQPHGHTLQATALVHEAYLKLVGSGKEQWENRRHFFAAAAEAMRHILIDRARHRLRARHGGELECVAFDLIEIPAPVKKEILILLNDALEELAARSPEQAQIVKLRFFVGLTETQISDVLGVPERSVQRHWAYARAWLFDRIETLRSGQK